MANKLDNIGYINSKSRNGFHKFGILPNIDECINHAQKKCAILNADNNRSDYCPYFGYKALDDDEVIENITDCNTLKNYYSSLPCKDKINPSTFSSFKLASKYPIAQKYQNLGCKNKLAFVDVYENNCNEHFSYNGGGQCWLGSNELEDRTFGVDGDIPIYITPKDDNNKLSLKDRQINTLNDEIDENKKKTEMLKKDLVHKLLYQKSLKTGKPFDELYKNYVDIKKNKEKYLNYIQLKKIVSKLTKKKDDQKRYQNIVDELFKEKQLTLKRSHNELKNNERIMGVVQDKINLITANINKNIQKYNVQEHIIKYLRYFMYFCIFLLIAMIIYYGSNKLPDINKIMTNVGKKVINKTPAATTLKPSVLSTTTPTLVPKPKPAINIDNNTYKALLNLSDIK